MKGLILASSSSYRQALLQRLRLPFDTVAPAVSEAPIAGESPGEMAQRLAALKARAVAELYPDATVIGSDQVVRRGEHILGKPGDAETACAQLLSSSGKQVDFYTGVCVIDGAGMQEHLEPFHVLFRELSGREIQRYVALEQPLDCAGSFKWEGLGSALFLRMWGDDPTALQGLPLIQLSAMLRRLGLDPLA